MEKNEDRLPLIIKGARQIGKTESILHFAEQNYSNIVSINFVLEPKYKMILSDGYAVEDIVKNISMIDTSKKFIAGNTLLIFDELQEFPDIATALKAFKIDGRFDVICSGSLLGSNYRKIHSNSVGYKTDYEMFSMDFEEFLWANKNLGVYKGALYENFVAEAFVKQGLGLYYYKKENATLEEDFFVRTNDELVPVEVKANRNRNLYISIFLYIPVKTISQKQKIV